MELPKQAGATTALTFLCLLCTCVVVHAYSGDTVYVPAGSFVMGNTGIGITTNCPSTLIFLTTFTATAGNKKVVLEWTTESEINNMGFNIYRAESENGEYVQINEELIPAKGSATQGATYTFTDSAVKNRTTYFYKLEDVDTNGTGMFHEIKSATPRFILGFFN